MRWKRKYTVRAIIRRPWKWVFSGLALIGLYDLFVAQFIPNPLVFPRVIDIPTRVGLSWQTWMVILLAAVLIMLFEGAHYHISSFENNKLNRVHVELWGYGSYALPREFGEPWRSAHSIDLSVANTSESIPLGILRFYLVVPGEPLAITPVNPDEIKEFTTFQGQIFQTVTPMPLSLHLKPKESSTGLLLFVHNDKGQKQKLYIIDESGISWTVNIDGSKLSKMSKRRAEEIHEL